MKLFHSQGHVIGGAMLIAATTIGVGMLALPIVTGPGGFFPSIFIYLACWAFLLCTGLLFLEVCSWMPEGANLITMASTLLGKPGKYLCWIVYLFLFEMVMIAHVAGGGAVTHDILTKGTGYIPSTLLYVLLFSPVIYLGTKIVDRLNLVIFSGVLFTYILFIFISATQIQFENLTHMNWGKAFAFFTLTASYIALSLAFVDFLSDGLHIAKKGINKIFLCLLVFIPPLMAWVGRYKKGYKTRKQLPGGKGVLFFLMVLVMIELGIEVYTHF